MEYFGRVKEALKYVDAHLDEDIGCERIAGVFHFSPYYFHRMFSAVVGKTIAEHIRSRRLEKACMLIAETEKTILEICLECGFDSPQAFSRSFKNAYKIPPSVYRKRGYRPNPVSVDDMIIKFTNRLRGGIVLNPKIIKKDALIIAGTSGDGSKTGEVWQNFEKLNNETGLQGKLSKNGYEIRLYGENGGTVHVGFAVKNKNADPVYETFELPASLYASFDVYTSRGYDSENSAIEEWLATNKEGYKQNYYDGKPYVVEYYDERFSGGEDSIVEIWVPVVKLKHSGS